MGNSLHSSILARVSNFQVLWLMEMGPLVSKDASDICGGQ